MTDEKKPNAWRRAQQREAEPQSDTRSNFEEGLPSELEKVRVRLMKLATRKERLALLRELGYVDKMGVLSPLIDVTWIQPSTKPGDPSAWLDPQFSRLSETDAKKTLPQLLDDFMADPQNLKDAIARAESDRDFELAAKLREHLKTELERALIVGDERLTFRRILDGEHRGKWRVTVGGEAYSTENPESFANAYARRKAEAAGLNEDGLTANDRYEIQRLAASGDVLGAAFRYISLSIVAKGGDAPAPGEMDGIVQDPKYRGLCDRSLLFCYEAGTPGFKVTPEFLTFLSGFAGDRPLNLALLQEAAKAFAFSRELAETAPQAQPAPPTKALHAMSPSEIAGLSAEGINAISPEELDRASDAQLTALTARQRQLARAERGY